MSFLFGLLLGAIQTGAFQKRTFTVYEGYPIHTFLLSTLMSISLWFSTHFVASRDYYGFIGFSLGCAVITTLMAYKQKLRRNEQTDSP